MSAPSNSADIKAPHSSVAGSANTTTQTLAQAARAWTPKGTHLENPGSTLARFANRLIDRVTGRAYSADEFAAGGIAAASGITYTTKTVAASVLAIPITHRYVAKTTGGTGEALTLANGSFLGQELTIRLVTDGGGAGTLTPTTKSGFTSVVLDDAGEFVTLEWTTSGWIITGLGGLTAQPTVNA
jgi:hypothetical protein